MSLSWFIFTFPFLFDTLLFFFAFPFLFQFLSSVSDLSTLFCLIIQFFFRLLNARPPALFLSACLVSLSSPLLILTAWFLIIRMLNVCRIICVFRSFLHFLKLDKGKVYTHIFLHRCVLNFLFPSFTRKLVDGWG